MFEERDIIYSECAPSLSGIRQARLYLAETLVDNTPPLPGMSGRIANNIILGFVEYTTNLIRHGDPSPLRIIYKLSVNTNGQYELHVWDDGGIFDEFNQRVIDQKRRSHQERGHGHHHGIYLLMRCFSSIDYRPRRDPNPFNHICLVAGNE